MTTQTAQRTHPLALPCPWPDDLLVKWAQWYAGSARPNTVKLRLSHVRKFARSHPDPWAVTLDTLTAYLDEQGWSASTRRSVADSLRTFYAWAAQTGRVSADPSELLRRPPVQLGVPRPAPEAVVRAAREVRDERLRLMVKLAAENGLRACEIAVIHSDDLMQDFVGWSLLVHGKGGHNRVLGITPAIAAALRLRGKGYAFPGQVDGHLSAAHVSKLLSRLLPEDVTGHMLRHFFGTNGFRKTRNIRAVQKAMGHRSLSTTAGYVDIVDDEVRDLIEQAAL